MNHASNQSTVFEKGDSIDQCEKYSRWLSSTQLELNFESRLPDNAAGIALKDTPHWGSERVGE